MNPSSAPEFYTPLFTSSKQIKNLGFSIAIVVALAYVSVRGRRRSAARVGPHTKLIVKFRFRQKFEYVQSFFSVFCFRDTKPPGSPAGSGRASLHWVLSNGWESVFLHSSDHQELWSLGN